jgi:hypothetical protein
VSTDAVERNSAADHVTKAERYMLGNIDDITRAQVYATLALVDVLGGIRCDLLNGDATVHVRSPESLKRAVI